MGKDKTRYSTVEETPEPDNRKQMEDTGLGDIGGGCTGPIKRLKPGSRSQ